MMNVPTFLYSYVYFLYFQWDALAAMFELAYLKEKDDYRAKELSRLFKVKEYYALLLFIYPILRDLRRITKLFQCHTGDNIQIFHELKDFIHK